jgi:imidazolonepropionase-like amidohydrolase
MQMRPGLTHRLRSCAVALLALAGACAQAADASPSFVLSGAQLLVAPDQPPIADGVVLIQGGRIVAVGERRAVSVPAGAQPLPCGGGVVTAGFQNSHVHFIGPQFDAAGQPADALAAQLRQMLTRYGFTTVVDTASDRGNTLQLRRRVEQGEVRGPRILMAGRALFPPQGLPFYLAGLERVMGPLPQPATPADALREVQENLSAGADGTKLFIATPQADGSVRRMPAAIARAAADETHRRGGLVMAHPTDIDGVRAALAAGVDVLLHTTIADRAAWPDALVRQLVAQRVSLVPTLKLWGYELAKTGVPPQAQPPLVAPTLRQLKDFADAGGQVLFGTDVGYMADADLGDEYRLMAQAGLTPMQILASLTTAPAARWQESGRRGRIAPGLDADLVVLEADPRDDAGHLARVRCTFRGGVPIHQK